MKRFEPKEIFVISSNENFTRYVRENLPSGDYQLAGIATTGTEARQNLIGGSYTVLLINIPLPDENGSMLASDLAGNNSSAVVVFVKASEEPELRDELESSGIFVIGRPCAHAAFQQVIYDAAAAQSRLQHFAVENHRLQTQIIDMRIINRAKWALIQYVGMDENTAHKFIEQQAMNMRISKRAAAENILKTYEHQV